MTDKSSNDTSKSDKKNSVTTDETAETKPKPAHLWKKGQSGNPKGRKKGSRNKITKAYLTALRKDFEKHGIATLEKVREKDPKTYMKLVADLVPKEIDLDPNDNGDVTVMIVKSFDAVPENKGGD